MRIGKKSGRIIVLKFLNGLEDQKQISYCDTILEAGSEKDKLSVRRPAKKRNSEKDDKTRRQTGNLSWLFWHS